MIFTALQRIGAAAHKKAAAFFVIFLLFAGPLAQAKTILPETATPAMWMVEKGEAKVYFLGSFHVLPKTMAWNQGDVQKAFADSDVYVMETVMDAKGQGEIAMLMMKNSMLPPGYSLKTLLDDDHYQKALKLTAPLGLSEAQVTRLQPWYLAIMLSAQTIIANGLDPSSGVDHTLQGLAEQGGKEIAGLETTKEQIEALAHHPLEVQSAMLSDTLDKMDQFDDYMHDYISAWASGDAKQIEETMVEEMKSYPSMYEALLVNRNKKWAPKIAELIESGKNVMIVVGLAHLVGDDSVLNILKEKGYRIERVQ
ncbi:TraB/GumN family protein [Emcibacter nanhaiensis]|uniref:TraB/GumN family protein n=1 Tax=Emcibacter nanhaiensis TaxID=1505037 RepID=A0A501PBK5_9PROT|nr:TraB/GumN family protein [Emcibacter nanhaiensis]TPD57789.1 TraB/GumN family protein [Emcibacter nanhaiensis]